MAGALTAAVTKFPLELMISQYDFRQYENYSWRNSPVVGGALWWVGLVSLSGRVLGGVLLNFRWDPRRGRVFSDQALIQGRVPPSVSGHEEVSLGIRARSGEPPLSGRRAYPVKRRPGEAPGYDPGSTSIRATLRTQGRDGTASHGFL